MSVRTQIERLNAIKSRMRTNLVAQGVTVPADTVLDSMAEMVLSVAGEDGISVTHSWSGTTLNVTSASGTSSANLKGDKGDTGATGLNWRGEWDEAVAYEYRDAVVFNGAAYIHVYTMGAPEGIEPGTDEETWELLASKGDAGFSIYTHTGAIDDGSSIYTASIKVPEGRTLQVGDLVLGTNSTVCKVASISSDGVLATLSLVASIKGADGRRGTGILKITTAPSSYTTETGGFTPTYRVALSTVLSQAKASEVLVGDTVAYNYYQYVVGYVDSSYVYLGSRASIRGASGAAGADGAKGDTGATGQRGAGIYSVTTAPSSYTTEVGGFTPKYRISLSTAKTQSGATEIIVGDQIRYSYYTYPIGYVDASYAYMATRVSLRGATGADGADGVSVTHEWNGTTLTVTSASGTSSADLKGESGAAGNYKGKNILFMGDSMLIQSQPTHGWIGLFNQIIEPASFVNTAVSGATWTETSSTIYDGNPVSTNQTNNVIGNQIEKIARGKDPSNANYSEVAEYANFDIIMIAAGINDYSIKTDEPDIEDSFTTSSAVVALSALDRKNFASAFRYNVERIQNLYPSAQLFICTPTQVALGSRTYASVKGKRDHIIALCNRMSVTYIDTFMCGIYSVREVNNGVGQYLKDGVHPNDAGKAVIANYNAREVIKHYIGSAVDVPVPDVPVITYTNKVPTSIDASGAVFNGVGYQDNARINSSGALSSSAANHTTVTGFIKVSGGDVVRVKGCAFMNIEGNNANSIGVYNSAKTHLGTTTVGGSAYGIFSSTYSAYNFSSVVEEKTGVYKWVVPPTASGVEWIRLSCYGDGVTPGANLIVTVNEEIA